MIILEPQESQLQYNVSKATNIRYAFLDESITSHLMCNPIYRQKQQLVTC